MPNPDSPEAKAFREQFKSDILKDPLSAFQEFLANAEDATNSSDPVIANRGWERMRELLILSAVAGGSSAPKIDTDAIAAQVKTSIQGEIDALAKSKDDDFAALSQRITVLETPLEPSPVKPANVQVDPNAPQG